MTDAEIAGYMGWRGPGAYTAATLRKIKRVVAEAENKEREACAKLCEETEVFDYEGVAVMGDRAADRIRERSNVQIEALPASGASL